MPMFLRAFFTDYVEYLVVALGLSPVCFCLSGICTWRSVHVVGFLAGLVMVANPLSLAMVTLTVSFGVMLGATTSRQRAVLVVGILATATAVVLAGLLLFRWRYGIHNVYQPTIDFARTYEVAGEPLRSPRLEWLGKFTWLFAPVILLVAASLMALRTRVRFDRLEVGALLLCAVQYTYQWIDEFVRGGVGLEVPYYWSYSYPSFAVAFAVVVCKFTSGARSATLVAIAGGWILFLAIGVPDPVRFPGGLSFGLVAGLLTVAVVMIAEYSPSAAIASLVLTIGWTQVGAPHYDPSSCFRLNLSPEYDRLFGGDGDESEAVLREAVWFAEQMDLVPNDPSAYFVSAGGDSGIVVALYAPQVVGHLVALDGGGPHLEPSAISAVKGGLRPLVVAYGRQSEVAAIVGAFADDLGVGAVLLDTTHDDALEVPTRGLRDAGPLDSAVHVAGRFPANRKRTAVAVHRYGARVQ